MKPITATPIMAASEYNRIRRDTAFRFKQFSVSDRHSAMKIGTDGVLLGAWASVLPGETVWDVGAGSGLISLMLLQRGAGQVVAVEISSDAVKDIRANAAASPWSSGLSVAEGDFSFIWPGILPRPSLIVSNPPFFNENIHSPEAARDLARHESTLNFGVLFQAAGTVLSDGGRLCLIAPASRAEELMFEGRLKKLMPRRVTYVKTSPKRTPSRVLLEFVKGSDMAVNSETLSIRDNTNCFSEEYRRLTADFYLDF